MTIEKKLKEYILKEYKSLRNFVQTTNIDLPYSTIDGMLKRDIGKASIDNVIKLCKVLEISVDELEKNRIVPANFNKKNPSDSVEISEIIEHAQNNLDKYAFLTLDQKPLTNDELKRLFWSLGLVAEFMREYRNKSHDVDKKEN